MTSDPVCCAPSATAEEAARQMRDGHIGDVLVCENGRLDGIVTDRDIVVRVAAEGRRPDECLLREISSHDVVTVAPDDGVDRAVQLMKERAVRRLPVCEGDGRLVGVISLGDLAVARDRDSALGEISAAPAND
jgi:CBS domain-containing protein